jgi:hypothetical protein
MARRARAQMRIDAFRYFRILVSVFDVSLEAAHIAVAMRSGGVISVAVAMRSESDSEASQASCSASWLRSTIEIKNRYLLGFIFTQAYLGN